MPNPNKPNPLPPLTKRTQFPPKGLKAQSRKAAVAANSRPWNRIGAPGLPTPTLRALAPRMFWSRDPRYPRRSLRAAGGAKDAP